jgi:hypothetical protein
VPSGQGPGCPAGRQAVAGPPDLVSRRGLPPILRPTVVFKTGKRGFSEGSALREPGESGPRPVSERSETLCPLLSKALTTHTPPLRGPEPRPMCAQGSPEPHALQEHGASEEAHAAASRAVAAVTLLRFRDGSACSPASLAGSEPSYRLGWARDHTALMALMTAAGTMRVAT